MSAPDPGHLLPDEVWAAVTAQAQQEAERIAAGERAAEAPAQLVGAERYGTGALALSGVVTANRHGGSRPAPTFGVLHSAETPLQAGYAAAIARMFRDTTADKSCHYMTDPAETWGVLDDLLTAWHVGTGNTNSVGLEQAGYARFTRAEWTTPAGLAQMDRNAAVMRACRDRYGIGLYWMTDAQLLQAHRRQIVGGWATHDQCRRVLGGTTHTDPMPNYPLDLLMARANGGNTPATTKDETMRLMKVAGTAGPIYTVTDLEVAGTDDIVLVDSLARVHGVSVVDVNATQLARVVKDAADRRARLGLPVKASAAVTLDAAAVTALGKALAADPALVAGIAGATAAQLAQRLQA